MFHVGNLFGGKAVAAHAFAVKSGRFGAVAGGHEIWRHIFVYARGKGGHGVIADAAELEHQRVAAQHDIIADFHMPRQAGIVGKNGVAADYAVVREMAVSHNPVIVADARFADAGYRAGVERSKFADGVAVADNQPRGFAAVFFVLRLCAQTGKLENAVVFADLGMPFNHGVRADFGVRANLDVFADNAVRTHGNAAVQLCFGVDDGGGVDSGHFVSFVKVCGGAGCLHGVPRQMANRFIYCLRCANAHTALTSGSPAYIACSVRSSLLS